jgi:hypothetical protein
MALREARTNSDKRTNMIVAITVARALFLPLSLRFITAQPPPS